MVKYTRNAAARANDLSISPPGGVSPHISRSHTLAILTLATVQLANSTPGFILLFMAEAVHIGKAAKLAGVSVDTIRFYQRLGLIKSAGRSAGGYRLFDGEQIRDLTFVRHAQELGFSLTEVKELMPLRQKHHVCSEVQSMLNHKLGAVREKINSLARLEAELADAL